MGDLVKMPVVDDGGALRTYKHLRKRVLNVNTGSFGRIVGAVPDGKTVWRVTVAYDDGHSFSWSNRELLKIHELVAEDYALHLPAARGRALAIVADLEKNPLGGMVGHYTGKEYVVLDAVSGRSEFDTVTFYPGWHPSLSISLWGAFDASKHLSVRLEDQEARVAQSYEDRFKLMLAKVKALAEAMPEG